MAELIQEILYNTLGVKFAVAGDEISDGKYRIFATPKEGFEYIISCKARYSKYDLIEAIFNGIVEPYLKHHFIKS